MLKFEDVLQFKNTLLYLSNLSYYQFDTISVEIWGDRGDHMTDKLWREKKENIWDFFVCLDDVALAELTEWTNKHSYD